MTQVIANTGATLTSKFIMEGVNVENKQVAIKPLVINLPHGWCVTSTYIRDICIPGLSTILMGNIVLDLALALLIRAPLGARAYP